MAEIVSTRGRVGRKKTNATEEFKEKMAALSQHFNAVVFRPLRQRLVIRGHESLLKRLGLWEFANLDFDETVREDMVKELVLCYRPLPGKYNGYSIVNGARIAVNRAAIGKALRLPPPANKGAKGRHFWVTKEEGSFLEELIWRFLVLRDDGDDASVMSESYVVEFVKVLGEMRFESADWAGLVWFMVNRELSRGTNLVNCYYASHLQLVLKHQRPELFENSGKESVANTKDSHSSDCNVSVTEPGSSRSNPVEIAGHKRTRRDAYPGMESMQITQGHFQNAYVEDRKNEEMMHLDRKENDVNERCEKQDGVMEVKETGAASEAYGCSLLGVKEGMMEDKENEASISVLLKEDVNMAKIDAFSEKTDEESQNAFKHLERGEGSMDLPVLQASAMTGNASRSHASLGQVEDSMDFDLYTEKMKVWAARFADSAKRKLTEKQISNSMLQKKIKDQNQMIQQYELMLHKERQQKQHYEAMLQMERQQKLTSNYKCNRELHLMEKVVEDYREAMKQTRASFAEYRERVQLPEEPLYMPHPDGGGDVILVSEGKKLEDERQKIAIETTVKDFEEEWMGKMEEQLGIYDKYSGRLEDLEYEVRTISGKFMKP